jgi:hypothetical protein
MLEELRRTEAAPDHTCITVDEAGALARLAVNLFRKWGRVIDTSFIPATENNNLISVA